MAISTSISIQIGEEKLSRFSKLVINQKINTHHKFSVLQPLPKEFVSQAIDKAQSYIGQAIKIEISPSTMSTLSPFVFNGIITEAQMVRTAGAAGGIIINGYSPTIAMEGTPTTKSYTDKSLADIVKGITDKYTKQKLSPKVSIQNDSAMPYTVQYSESDFGFLARMAQKKGEWFFFDGESLQFGKPTSKTFSLEYGRSLHSFNIEMRAKSLGFEYVGYDPSASDTQRVNSSEVGYEPQGYSKNMFDASKKLFPDNSTLLYSHALEEGNSRTHLVNRATTQLQSRAADLVTAKGDSDETGLRLGDVVVIQESAFSMTGNPLDGLQEQNFGSYIITDIVHVCDESGTYHNTFDAVPESVLCPPYGNVHSHPSTDSQPAVVIDNNDPAGLGRVQVQFAWQKDEGNNTPWIRMTNPHAGGGKGMYFIPEIGEEVLIAFEAGNAEKPFVLGTMYNGNESSGYNTAGNDQKVIHTRSGTKMIMNDAIGSVFIEDPSGNTWFMDGKGNISVNAPKNFTVNAGENIIYNAGNNIIASAQKNVNIIAGESITELANDDYSLTASNIFETAQKGRSSKAASITENMEKGHMISTKEAIHVESAKEVNINSGKKVKMQ
jgi:type VI secretion system secreted protein VgrG